MNKGAEILKFINESNGVSIDTRTLKKGEVFFALKGDNFDGNKFVNVAIEKGAALVVTSDKIFSSASKVVVVGNSLKTLQNVAKLHRDRLNIPVIGLTGTNGKTTTKELLCRLLGSQFNTLCTSGNFNNHIGVPLTLLKIKNTHQIAVVEMGASSVGEIDFLCSLAKPTHGLITSIGIAHIDGFGSIENIVKTKLELYHYLKKHAGLFFYNREIKELKNSFRDYENIISFSTWDLKGENVSKMSLNKSFPFLDLDLVLPNADKVYVKTNLYGEYNFSNIVNAVKIADYFDISVENIKNELTNFIPKNNRSQFIDWNGNELIMDAYNANPTSLKLAIKTFENIKTVKNKYLILGDMLELGVASLEEHIKILRYLRNRKFYIKGIFIGKEFLKAKEKLGEQNESMIFVEKASEVRKIIEELNINGSLILVKASRGIKAETIFE